MKTDRFAVAAFIAIAGPTSAHGQCQVSVDRHVSTFDASGGAVDVLILSEPDCPCELPWSPYPSSYNNWITVSSSSAKYPYVATIECSPNLDGPKREAVIAVGGTCHRVIQAGGAVGTVHCWGDNTYGQSDVPAGAETAVAVAAGQWSTTALLPDGTVRRWGLDSNVPSSLMGVRFVSPNHAISGNGEVHSLIDAPVPKTLSSVVEVVDGWLHSVALTAEGTVHCWGNNIMGQCDVPTDLGPVLAVAAGRLSSAALTVDGRVREWGQTYGIEPPQGMPPALRLVKGWGHTVADTGVNGLWIWGSSSWIGDPMSEFHNDAYPVRHLTAGQASTLVIDTQIHLWGSTPDPGDLDLNAFGPPLDAAVGSEHGVLIASDAVCATNGWETGGASLPPQGGTVSLTFDRNGVSCQFQPEIANANWLTIVAISEHGRQVIVDASAGPIPTSQRRTATVVLGDHRVRVMQFPETDGRWYVTGLNPSLNAYSGDMSDFVQVEVGYGHAIARRADGSVVGWGDDAFGQATPPADLGPAIDIAAGQAHSAALMADGTIRCWGWNCCGQTSVPTNLQPAVDIAASFNATAAVLATGHVQSWGQLGSEPAGAPAQITNAVQVAGGTSHFIALRSDGTVAAWGQNYAQQTAVPDDLEQVAQIAAGPTYSLAVLTDGSVRAWGFSPSAASRVPDSLSDVVQVAAGGDPVQRLGFSAALRENGNIVVWGDSLYGSTCLPTDLGPAIGINGGYRELIVQRDSCPADLTADGITDGADISVLLGFWGLEPGPYPAADINGDGLVDGTDLANLLGNWGPCQ